MAKNKITPIKRVNKFFSFEDFNIDVEMGREALEGDNNLSVVLFRVDRINTQSVDIYGEARKNDIRYLPPVELPVATLNIDETENMAYNSASGSMRYKQRGKLTFNIYSQTLSELDVELSFGDFIGYSINETSMVYYSIVNDGLLNIDNAKTMMGYKGYFRTVVCAAVEENEFSGK